MKSLFLGLILFAITGCSHTVESHEGTYESKSPNTQETIRIMYMRGYFHYLYTDTGDIKLSLKADKSFKYIVNDTINHYGAWSVERKELKLDYDDPSREDITFTVSGNKLYRISETVLCKDKSVMKHLLLMEKK